MEAEGAGRFRAGIPSAGHAGRVAELSVESRHAGIRCSAGRSRRYDHTGRAGVSGGHRQFRQHSRVWCTVSVQSGQIRAGRDRPVLSHHRHAQHHHRSRHSFGIRRNEAGAASGPAAEGEKRRTDRHYLFRPEFCGKAFRHHPAVLQFRAPRDHRKLRPDQSDACTFTCWKHWPAGCTTACWSDRRNAPSICTDVCIHVQKKQAVFSAHFCFLAHQIS